MTGAYRRTNSCHAAASLPSRRRTSKLARVAGDSCIRDPHGDDPGEVHSHYTVAIASRRKAPRFFRGHKLPACEPLAACRYGPRFPSLARLGLRITCSDGDSHTIAEIVGRIDNQLFTALQANENLNGGPKVSAERHFLRSHGAVR